MGLCGSVDQDKVRNDPQRDVGEGQVGADEQREPKRTTRSGAEQVHCSSGPFGLQACMSLALGDESFNEHVLA